MTAVMDSKHVPVVPRDPYRNYAQVDTDHESMVAEAFRSAIYRQQTDLELTNWLSNLRQQQAALASTPVVPQVLAPAATPVPRTQALKHPSEITTSHNGKRGRPQKKATPGMCKTMTPGKPQRKKPQRKSSGADKPLSPEPSLVKPPPQATSPQPQSSGPGRPLPRVMSRQQQPPAPEKPPPRATNPQRHTSASQMPPPQVSNNLQNQLPGPEKPPPRAKTSQRQSSAPQKTRCQSSSLQHQSPASGTSKPWHQAHDPGLPPPGAANPPRHTVVPETPRRQAACRTWNNDVTCRFSPCKFRHECERCSSTAHPSVHHDRAVLVQRA